MNKVLDDFKQKFKSKASLHDRIRLSWDFAELYYDSFRTELEPLLIEQLQQCIDEKYLNGEIVIRVLLSQLYFDNMRPDLAMENVDFVTKNMDRIDDRMVTGYAKLFISMMSAYMGDYAKALNLSMEATADYVEYQNMPAAGWCPYSMAIIYFDLKDFKNAGLKFDEALIHFQKHDYAYGIARSETGLASVKIQEGDYEGAEKLFLKALEIYSSMDMLAGMSRVYNDLGIIYKKRNNIEKAAEYLHKGLDLRREINHSQGLATSLNEVSEVLILLGRNQEAIQFLEENITHCHKIGNKLKLYRAHHLLYQSYKNISRLAEALHHFELYDKIKEEVTSQSSNNKIKELEKKHAKEKSEKEAEIERIRNIELKGLLDLVEEKNKEILDSIRYAKRIQFCLMPTDKFIEKKLKDLRQEK